MSSVEPENKRKSMMLIQRQHDEIKTITEINFELIKKREDLEYTISEKVN